MTTKETTTAKIEQGDVIAWLGKQSIDVSIDLLIGSPPYALKGHRYGEKKTAWPTAQWVDWMETVTRVACLASRGWVIWIANGAVREGEYQPACEGLIWKLSERASGVVCERPCIWHKNAPPNRKDWFGNDWEYIMAFYHRDSGRPPFDWKAIGHPPKYSAGGRFRQRTTNGTRRLGNEYPTGKLARPRDVIRCTVGGGHLGSKFAHENEAPYPEELIRPFVKACCPVGGVVCDPFSGSGTTAAVALQEGRNFIGCDSRADQVELTQRRIAEARAKLTNA